MISIFEKLGYTEDYVYRNAILYANKKSWLKELEDKEK